MVKKRIAALYVENVQAELDYIIKDLESINRAPLMVKVDPAQSIVEAIDKIDKREQPYDALILDMMLPKDKDQLALLNKKEAEREVKWKEYREVIDKMQDDDDDKKKQVKELRKVLNDIDDEIDNLLDLEGGLTIAKYYKEKTTEITIPIIFFTARGEDHLKNKCRNFVGEKFGWIEKPATAEEIFSKLSELLKKNSKSSK